MEAKILKKVSPFLFFLLMIAMANPGIAQRNVKNNNPQKVKRASHYAYVNRTVPIRNEHRNHHFKRTNFRRGYSGFARPVVKRTLLNPIGQRVRFLPNDAIRFKGNQQDFFYSCGNFFRETHHGFKTVHAPVGARVRHLPHRTRAVAHHGDVYYKLDNILLSATVNRKGRVIYEVIGYA